MIWKAVGKNKRNQQLAGIEKQRTFACEGKENTTMGEGKPQTNPSRRRLLKSAGTLLAGGLIGCTSMNFSAPSKKTADAAPALPWPWHKIDPMEAGSRAYHIYLEAGG